MSDSNRPTTEADPRIAVLERALADAIKQWHHRPEAAVAAPEEIAAVMAPEILVDLDEADHLRGPIDKLKGKVPLVLYFNTKRDANAVAEILRQCMSCPVEISL